MGTRKRKPKKQCPHCKREFGFPGYYNHLRVCEKNSYESSIQFSKEDYTAFFKVILVGEDNSAKMKLVTNFTEGYFSEQYNLTIGVGFSVTTIPINEEIKVKLQVHDIGAQERFQYVRPTYYRGAMGAIVLFDVTNRESFDHVPKWIEEINNNAGEIPILLLGNTSNMGDNRIVSAEEVLNLAKELGVDMIIEGSVSDGSGLGDPFPIISCLMVGIPIPKEFLSGNHNIKLEKVKKEKKPLDFNRESLIFNKPPLISNKSNNRMDSFQKKLNEIEMLLKDKMSEREKNNVVICKICGAILDSEEIFCNKCGTPLK